MGRRSKRTPGVKALTDKLGNLVPTALQPAFTETETAAATKEIGELAARVRGFTNTPDHACLNVAEVVRHLKVAQEMLQGARPYCLCPDCKGHGTGCKNCGGCGYLSKMLYETTTPPEKMWKTTPKRVKQTLEGKE